MQATGQADVDWPAPAATQPVHATIRLPGSKSITNRALVLAALADTPTRITGPLQARDTDLMAGALTALGAAIDGWTGRPRSTHTEQTEQAWTVTPGWASGAIGVDVGNAGTVLRFVPPVASLAAGEVRFAGDARAAHRPVGQLLAALRQAGVEVDDDGRGGVPFVVRGRGRVRGGTVTLDASSSSQLVSGLMLAAPRYDEGLQITHNGPRIPSAPHIAMTAAMLTAAGAEVETGGAIGNHGASGNHGAGSSNGAGGNNGVPEFWRVRPGRLNPGTIAVEPDLSNAAAFLASALVTGGQITIPGWPAVSLQAATQILAVLEQMGGVCRVTADGLRIEGTGRIHGITADLRDVNELAPVLTAVAALADGPSEFTGIGHMRLHESDRLAVLAGEIGALGGQVTELPDGLRIVPRPLRAGPQPFDSHDDHRMVMAAAVLGLVVPGLQVRNAGTVAKTFPAFLALWQQMLEHAP
jgi:3-phosphoshikimate 1-carboxyvinyltransferase